jgi:protein-tyrosine phosphatase
MPLTAGGVTRKGMIYRSARLASLTDEDMALFEALKVRTVFDFRLTEERQRYPNRLPDEDPPRQIQQGFLPRGAIEMFAAVNAARLGSDDARNAMRSQYITMALEHTDIYLKLFLHLLEPGATPFLLHCSGGKDRTGIASAILLRAAGVGVEETVADYLLTNLDTPDLAVLSSAAPPALIAVVGRAHAEYLHAALAAIDAEFGSLNGYLREGIGLSVGEHAALVALLSA